MSGRFMVKIAVGYVAVASTLPAPGMAPASLDRLLAASDQVVVGKIVQGTVSGVSVALSIELERVLKGDLVPAVIVAANGTITESRPTRASALDRGIFFLSGKGNGAFRLVPPVSGYLLDERSLFIPLPSASTPTVSASAVSGPRERVLLELLGAIETGQTRPVGGTLNLFWEYHNHPTPALRSVLQRWTRSSSSKLVAFALRALIAEGDVTALSRIGTDETLWSTSTARDIFDGIKFYFPNPDPAGVSVLGQLATGSSTDTRLRAAAATALARIHTVNTLPHLAVLLDSPNLDLRTAAVGGLAMFANNVPIGSHEPAPGPWQYRTPETIAYSAMDRRLILQNDSYYVGFWKDWWEQRYSLELTCTIMRNGATLFRGNVSTGRLHRKFETLLEYLLRANHVPAGSVLLTGTGIIVTEDAALQPGDTVTIRIPEISELSNPAAVVE